MPMNWTAENDRLLLLKILETHNVTVDGSKILKAWPPNAPAVPTERAIKERIFKLRQMAGVKAPKSATNTPKKTAVTPKNPQSSGTGKKRKANDKLETQESDAENHMTDEESPTKAKSLKRSGGAVLFNPELKPVMDDPFAQRLAQPVFKAAQVPRARSARQASKQASESFRNVSGSSASTEDSQGSAYEQNPSDVEV
ncbi:unnamed protein product [Periconia digitata]|uniref:Uncharacterized protein n=1 Tax=Periconia digitata TaxID=1303443 RepID=A0A9W4UTL1_9PLEO|nr:unnamed protein product [Periconia digitata]